MMEFDLMIVLGFFGCHQWCMLLSMALHRSESYRGLGSAGVHLQSLSGELLCN